VRVENAWIHIDPCEAAYNDKQMYVGWGKKHTYVVAFAAGDEIVFEDVTEHYAADMAQVRAGGGLDDNCTTALQ